MSMLASHHLVAESAASVTDQDPLAFFHVWTRKDLEEATAGHQRARQARWSVIAVILLLWRWALTGRKLTFEQVLPQAWPVVAKIMITRGIPMSQTAVTPTALGKARRKLGMEPLRILHEKANARMERRFDRMSLYKGLRLHAVDGSWLNLPSRQKVADAFGRPSSSSDQTQCCPQALLVTLDLVRLGWMVDYRLDRCDASELALAKELAETLGPGDLLLGDRLMFDTLWFEELDKRGVKFSFRANSNRLLSFTRESQERIEQARSQSDTIDCEVDLKIAADHRGRAKRLLRLRYVEVPLPNGEVLRIITNLPKSFASTQELAKLYELRWGIETDYRMFKGQNHLPVVRSRTESTIRQEILLRVLAHNSIRFVQAEACELGEAQSPSAFSPSGHRIDLRRRFRPFGELRRARRAHAAH